MQKNNYAVVGPPRLVSPRRVEFHLELGGEMVKAVEPLFWAEYGFDIDTVPPAVLTLPVLGTLLPIAWALDATVEVAHMDQDLFEAMDDIKAGMVSLYPKLKLAGDVIPQSLDRCRNEKADGSTLLLFSGGLDSLAGYLDPKGRPDHLLIMAGGDIKLDADKAWSNGLAVLDEFATKHVCNAYSARANAADPHFTKGAFLNHRFRHVAKRWNWGIRIQHGMAILSESAPAAWVAGASTVRISASYCTDYSLPNGSAPEIDSQVAFAGMTCEHSGYELKRSAKGKLVVDKLPGTNIRVCRSGPDGGNCGVCRKCAMTLASILIAGADPNDYGLPTDTQSLDRIMNNVDHGHYRFAPGSVMFWRDHIDAAQQSDRNAQAPDWAQPFLDWLKRLDMDVVVKRAKRRFGLGDRLGFIVNRYLPLWMSKSIEKAYVATMIRPQGKKTG